MNALLLLVLCVVSIRLGLDEVSGYKILMTALPGRSHVIGMSAVGKELARRGHQVHFLVGASFEVPIEPNTPNLHVERFGSPDFKMIDYDHVMTEMTKQVLEIQGGTTDVQALLDQFFEDDARQLLDHSEHLFEKFEKIKFDIAIIDGIFMLSYQFLVPHRLGIPYITTGFLLSCWDFPSPVLPSLVPSKLTSNLSDRMTFTERLINTFFTVMQYTNRGRDPAEDVVSRYRKYGHFETSHDLVSRSVFFFPQNDPVLDYPTPTMPNTINVGGLTVQPASGKPLPQDIEQFISAKNDGVILVTFGTLARRIPRHIAEKFIAAFSRLSNYMILWRLENKDNLPIPDNVMISQWLPQNDLLADKRIKLFITHCGVNGQFEALYHAVPMIGFPIYVDQGYNAKRIEAKGFGIAMNIHDFTSEQMVANVKKILDDDSFKNRISKGSEIYRSARDTPVERVAYWTEHVLKFGGDYLKPGARELNVFQYLMLDIVAFIVVVALTVILVVGCIVKAIVVRCCCRKPLLHGNVNGKGVKASNSKKSK